MPERTYAIDIITRWKRANPKAAQDVTDRLNKLAVQYLETRRAIRVLNTDEEKRAVLTRLVTGEYEKEKEAIVRSTYGGRMYYNAQKELGRLQEQNSVRMKEWGKTINRVGYRIGWLSFRMVIMGRILTNYMVQPIKWMLREMGNWESGVNKMVEGLAILQATGLDTGGVFDSLLTPESISKIVEAGMLIQGAMGAIYAVMMNIAADIAPILAPAIIEIAGAFAAIWEDNKDVLLPMLQTLIDEILPPLISLIQELGPILITSFVQGLTYAVPALQLIIAVMTPWLPILAGILGFLIPFAPLIMLLGTAMFFLSPILNVIGILMGVMAGVAPALAAGFTALSGGIASIGGAVTATIGGWLVLIGVLTAVSIAVWSIVAAVAFFTGQWESFTGGIANVIDSIAGMLHGTQEAGMAMDDLSNKTITPEIHPGYNPEDYESGYGGAHTQDISIQEFNLNIENVENIDDLEGAIETTPGDVAGALGRRF
jgi:hypothetical protein